MKGYEWLFCAASMKQSRVMSLIEAVANVVVGYVLAIESQIVVFPWFGIETGLAEHLSIGLAFVGVSLVRGYLLRRALERWRCPQAMVDPRRWWCFTPELEPSGCGEDEQPRTHP
jgi:hypothetical protein